MNAVIEKKIGNNIRRLREKSGLTQEQVAAKLQINGCDITRELKYTAQQKKMPGCWDIWMQANSAASCARKTTIGTGLNMRVRTPM